MTSTDGGGESQDNRLAHRSVSLSRKEQRKKSRLAQLELLRDIKEHASFSNLSPVREGGIADKVVRQPALLTYRKKAHLRRQLSHWSTLKM